MKRVIIIGTGGHGEVVADILKCCIRDGQQLNLLGFLDDDNKIHGKIFSGLSVLGSVEEIDDIQHDSVIIAIGNNGTRQVIFEKLLKQDKNIISAVHPSSIIASDVKIGKGCVICAGVIINTGSTIGHNVILNTGCTIDHHNFINAHVHIAPGVHTGGDVTVGSGTLIGIGTHVIPGKTIGNRCIVGGGALVTKDFQDDVQIIGSPARISRYLE